jgi:hypothetical protein
MATYAFPAINPSAATWQLISNTASFVSPFTGATQTLDRGGERWSASLTFNNLSSDDRGVMTAFVSRLNGQQHRFTLQNHAEPQRGTLNGTPLVQGAAQTGTSIDIDGATPSQTGWIRAGDFFSVNGELKMCVVDADSDGSGNVTIEFTPRLRVAPANDAPVTVSGGTSTFLLSNDGVAWSNIPGGFSSLTIECFEDIT